MITYVMIALLPLRHHFHTVEKSFSYINAYVIIDFAESSSQKISVEIHFNLPLYQILDFGSSYHDYSIKVESKSNYLYYFPVVLRGNEKLKYNS